jgi:Carboxypeptidase regulatory-like domain
MRSYRFIVLCICSLMIVLTSTALFAQHATGGVNGTVTDPSGAVVAGANVTLTNQDTNVVSHSTTSNTGYFVFWMSPLGLMCLPSASRDSNRWNCLRSTWW